MLVMSKEIIATYEMIKGYKNYPSNYILTISEFIDNSIGSYQDNNPENDINGLEITIEFNTVNQKNKRIIISDNAKGMSADELENAMQPNDRRNKNDTQYNQYGVGMKLGIFWYGAGCTIWSKKQNGIENKLELLTTDNDAYSKIVVDAKKSTDNRIKTSSGTIVEISSIYDNRDITNKYADLEKLSNGLGWRYNKLIQRGLKIKIKIRSSDSKKDKDILIEPYFNKPFNIKQLIDDKTNSSQNKKQRENYFDMKIQEIYDDLLQKYNNGNLPDEVLQVYNLINERKDVTLSKKLFINGKEAELIFSIIDADTKNKAQYSGVTIYHMDRAIMHGPNDKQKNQNFEFVERTGASGAKATFRWLYGELNLTGIEVPDENKSSFSWSKNGKEELQNELEIIHKNLEPFLKMIASMKDIKTNSLPTESTIKEILEQTTEKFNFADLAKPRTFQNENYEQGIKYDSLEIFGDKFQVQVLETENSNCKFIQVDKDYQNKSLNIYIESENKFWKPFVTNADFKGKLLYPLAILLGFAELTYNNPEYESTKSFSEIVSELIEKWVI